MCRENDSEIDVPEASSELISAFVDGETVDVASLAKALTAPGGRETLLDFLALRERLHDELDVRPGADFFPSWRERIVWNKDMRGLTSFRIVAVAALSLALGIAVGLGLAFPRAAGSEPPPANRVLRFEPGVDWYANGGEEPPQGTEEW